jgi:histidine triad (HIT) family protein
MVWSAARGPYRLRLMGDTIFSKILRGDIPCHKVYEDDLVLAFLDIGPLSFGHTLVIPKEDVATVDQLSDDTAAAIGRVLPRLCRAITAVTGAEQFNILQNSGPMAHQAVFHVHFHIIPKPSVDRGLVMEWASTKLDPDEGARLAAALTKEIGE